MRFHAFAATLVASVLTILPATIASSAGAPDLSKLYIVFDSDKHSMYFHDPGWFEATDYPVKFRAGHWQWQSPSGQWTQLLTPFVARWNEKYHLILDAGGRIVVSAKDNSRHWEIRLIHGEWYHNISGEWTALDEMYDN